MILLYEIELSAGVEFVIQINHSNTLRFVVEFNLIKSILVFFEMSEVIC